MAAKKAPIDTKSVADLGLQDADIFNQRVVYVSLELPPEKSGGRKIDGSDPAAAAREAMVRLPYRSRRSPVRRLKWVWDSNCCSFP